MTELRNPSRETRAPHAAMAAKLCCLPLALASALVLSGCYPHEPYQKPSVAMAPAYKEAQPGAAPAASDVWKPAAPNDAMARGKWWEIFGDPELNQLEEKLNINNQNIAQYFQNYMAARSQVAQIRSSYWPTISVGASLTRTRTPAMQNSSSNSGSTSTSQTLQLPLSISWQPDFFGKIRNQVKEYTAAAQVSAADLENERLSEQSSLAQYYFEMRGQDSLQKVYDETLTAYRQALALTQDLVKSGLDSDEDLAEAQAAVHTAEANAVAVHTARAQYEHAIALLVGEPASSFSLPAHPLDVKLPTIPAGLPSQLLERRPDIAAAERSMAEANALIGVGKSAYYPTISLSLAGGVESSAWSKLLNLDNRYWSMAPSASETVFDGGSRKATLAQYRAQYQANVAAYRQTVLNGFKEVEDYLVASRQLSEQVSKERQAVDDYTRYRDLALTRYRTGVDTYLNVLTAETSRLSNQLTLEQLRTQQATAVVELIAALGGGWDSAQLPTEADIRKK